MELEPSEILEPATECQRLLFRSMERLIMKSDLPGAERLLREAVAEGERTLEPDHPHLADAIYQLGQMDRWAGRLGEAETHLKRASALYERAQGPGSRGVANAASELANLYQEQGDLARAEALYRQALMIREASTKAGKAEKVSARFALASCLEKLGRDEEAESLRGPARAQIIAAMPQELILQEGMEWNIDLDSLAPTDREVVEQSIRTDLRARERLFGPDHPSLLGSVDALVVLLRARGQDEEADRAAVRAEAIRSAAPPANEPAAIERNIDLDSRPATDWDPVEQGVWEDLRFREHLFGPDHPCLLDTLDTLAALLNARGQGEEAERAAARAEAIRRAAPPENETD